MLVGAGLSDHAEFMEMISRPVFEDPVVDLGNLSEFRRSALANPRELEAARI